MKKKSFPILAAGGLILLTVIIAGIVILVKKYTPSKEQMDLSEYYNISAETQVAVILDDMVYETHGTLINDHVYLDYQFVHDYLNSRFYWDYNENILLYTTASDVVSANVESSTYTVGKASTDFGRVIVKATADSALIDIDFVSGYSKFTYDYYDSPSRVVIRGTEASITVATVKKNTQIRYRGGIKSPILCNAAKSSSVTVLEADEKWTKVCTTDGIVGYIRSNALKDSKSVTPELHYTEEEFQHMKLDKPVNLLWHQVSSSASNDKISDLISSSKGLNVISPTWFQIIDNSGNISSNLASKDYVDYCHNHNVEVWGLISNVEDNPIDIVSILNHTSSRQNLVNQLIAAALKYNLDGINVDIEFNNGEKAGDGYIQFIRELSIKCENNDLILSVDVPIPASYNTVYQYSEQHYFADYVIVMGYDEHINQSTGEGSVASLSWVREAVENTLAEGVPADQFILAMPFYTRLWNVTPTSDEINEDTEYLIGCEHMNLTAAKNWMNENVSEPIWLEDCGQWYGETTKDGVTYKMWLEDETSMAKRLELLNEYSLAGGAFWSNHWANSTIWDTIIKYIN